MITAFAALLAAGAPTLAQDYPAKPVRVVVAFTAGSAIDVLARVVAQRLGEQWSQQVIVENRPGAGGSVGASAVARAVPDGYTLLVHTNAYATNPALYSTLPYDPAADLKPVAPFGTQPYLLIINPNAGAKTLGEFVDRSKARPGGLTYGSAGTGSGTHFVAEKFRLATGLQGTHVPYKGGPEATGDVIAGRIDYWFPPISIALAAVSDGKVVPIAVTGAKRSGLLPNVPTLAEAGLAGFDASFWSGVWVPAKTPDAVVNKLSADIASALSSPTVRERLSRVGVEPLDMSPSAFEKFVRSETEDAARIVKAVGMKTE
jgi:tripartite-type tricarboxylate transporter receptor subunit TctC